MPLNESKGNMYDFVTHTWNTVKGECEHGCSYCYMKRWGRLREVRFDERELRTDLGSGNFIFVGSSNDLFAAGIPDEWIRKTLDHCAAYDNRYLFQSKNPGRILDYIEHPVFADGKAVVCTTIESDCFYPQIMGNTPTPEDRATAMKQISEKVKTYVTIEPIMRFSHYTLLNLIGRCNAQQVNIGADSGRNRLPEPTSEQIQDLIVWLEKFTIVNQKSNLKRLLK